MFSVDSLFSQWYWYILQYCTRTFSLNITLYLNDYLHYPFDTRIILVHTHTHTHTHTKKHGNIWKYGAYTWALGYSLTIGTLWGLYLSLRVFPYHWYIMGLSLNLGVFPYHWYIMGLSLNLGVFPYHWYIMGPILEPCGTPHWDRAYRQRYNSTTMHTQFSVRYRCH